MIKKGAFLIFLKSGIFCQCEDDEPQFFWGLSGHHVKNLQSFWLFDARNCFVHLVTMTIVEGEGVIFFGGNNERGGGDIDHLILIVLIKMKTNKFVVS